MAYKAQLVVVYTTAAKETDQDGDAGVLLAVVGSRARVMVLDSGNTYEDVPNVASAAPGEYPRWKAAGEGVS